MTIAENDGESYQQGIESRSNQSKQLSNINKAPKPSGQERWTQSFSKIMTQFKMIMSLTIFFAEGKQNMEDQLFAFLIGTCQGNSYKPLSDTV